MQIFFSTVVRKSPLNISGELVKLDWSSKQIIKKVPIIPEGIEYDPNPRGNARGGRGIEVMGDTVVIAAYHTLMLFDKALNHQKNISHNLMVGLHET